MIDRMWRIGVFVLVALFSVASQSQQPEQDWLVVPGKRVGAITAETSDAALATLFGSQNLQRINVSLGEGFTAPGTAVYPDDAARRLEVVWSDGARTIAKEVRLTGDSSVWHTAEGISLGSTLREIERLNRFPFKLVGFAFDYGGTIIDCGRGRLAMLGCSGSGNIERGPQGRLVIIRLQPGVSVAGAPEYRQVQGDRVFSSAHPAMQALNPRVYQMVVSLGPSGGVRRPGGA